MCSNFDKDVLLEALVRYSIDLRQNNNELRRKIWLIEGKIKKTNCSPSGDEHQIVTPVANALSNDEIHEEQKFASKHQILDSQHDYEDELRYVVDEMGVPYFECDD